MLYDKTCVEITDIFVLELNGEHIFFEISKINEGDGTVGIYEIEKRKLSSGIGIKIPIVPAKNPKIITQNNTATKTTYFVHPLKLDQTGPWLLPIDINGWTHYAAYVYEHYNKYWPENDNCNDDIWLEPGCFEA